MLSPRALFHRYHHPIFLFITILVSGVTHAADTYIKDADDFVVFTKSVNSGTTYSGATVLLSSDIDFAGKEIDLVGNNSKYFCGTFDGQGYTIGNFQINSPSVFTGLFGLLFGSTIRNLVFDSSCSITSTFETDSSAPYVGGVTGICQSTLRECALEDIVNMGSVAFTGSAGDLHLGGIAGVLGVNGYSVSIKNCANYGSVTHSGTLSGYIDIGGIVGHYTDGIRNIQNCVNYGAIQHIGTTTGAKYIGGIVGTMATDDLTQGATIENCLSGGVITLNDKTWNRTGSILGYLTKESSVSIDHCYWTSDTGYNISYGVNNSVATVTDSSFVELNMAALNNLNERASTESWSEWFMLHLRGGKINNLNQETLIVTQKSFPEPVKEDLEFLFWCEDENCGVKYNSSETTNAKELYATWNASIVTFDFGNGTMVSKTFKFNKTIEYPTNVAREGYEFLGWEPMPEKMPATDITVVAQWVDVPSVPNTVTFDFGNGTMVNKTFKFDEDIEYPTNVTREGYEFLGWEPMPEKMPAADITVVAQWVDTPKIPNTVTFDFGNGTMVNKTFEFDETIEYPTNVTREGYEFLGWEPMPEKMPAADITVVAQWVDVSNASSTVEIVFGRKDLSKEEVESIIRAYTQDNCAIEMFDAGESDGIRVIIKFTDEAQAKEFVRNVHFSKDLSNNYIIDVNFVHGESYSESFSLPLSRPSLINSFLF